VPGLVHEITSVAERRGGYVVGGEPEQRAPGPKARRQKAGRRWALRLALALLSLFAVLSLGAVALRLLAGDAVGADATGERLRRLQGSPQWKGGQFENELARIDGPAHEILRAWIFDGSPHASPAERVPYLERRREDYASPDPSGLRVTWLGHSTLLLEIDGQRVLIDPIFGERASPFSFAGPKRFYPPPLPIAELPPLDAIVISHDHYDHLDHQTVLALARRPGRFLVPLGVGADLEAWGVAAERIVELDWWEEARVGALVFTATPARHFSGRWLGDDGQTLWAGWAIRGPLHRAFYSGDTALFPGFADIGERLGPFDLTMIETGAYDALWADVHLGPEQAVIAHQLVRGRVLLPVHWGLFDLALHGWTEPVERIIAAAERANVRVLVPRPGELVTLSGSAPSESAGPTRWWPALPWRPVEEAPAWSSNVEDLLRPAVPAEGAR
jgi:L-ascorbate metabolism protein UlaG (beta-lactamase superfamily)